MNKYYANREKAFPFLLVYRMGMEEDSIEYKDFLEELFKGLLLEIDGRITGGNILLEDGIGSPLDMDYIEDEDKVSIDKINLEADEIIFDERCKLIVEKRLKALRTFGDAIEIVYNMFYNSNQKELEKLVKEFQRS